LSGGHFDYNQFRINDIYEEIEHIIENNNKLIPDDYGGFSGYDFSQETIEEFKKGIQYLKLASIYAHRIDWLVSGDDGEESFHKRLKEEIEELKLEG